MDGQFLLNNLGPGRYRIKITLPADSLYVKALELVNKTIPPKSINVAAHGLSIGQGEQISGLKVVIVDGAATISGRVVPAKEGENLPGPLKIFLIPLMETEKAEDVLRYQAVLIGNNYSYRFANIPPGQYWLLARPENGITSADRDMEFQQFSSASRLELRRIAGRIAMKLTLPENARIENQEIVFYQE
jgi:hypothetical protein